MRVRERPWPDIARLRASDADRDRVADRLREALAEGRLTVEEHAERLDAVYAAKTYADLEPIVADLPAPESGDPLTVSHGGHPAPPVVLPSAVSAFFGAARRTGRWLVPPNGTVTACFGEVELDLCQAVLSQREVTITLSVLFGTVTVKVPPGVRVESSVGGLFGGSSLPSGGPYGVDAPVVRLAGFVMFGSLDVRR